ncbi:hypothetical protein LX95_02403 [Mesonia algae]|uniref:Uncharacterized protein n=1 Tax=Mesonia algae TaxID=213248 RepID=A0A2W7HX75_9FLAO|nr:hypothetical protein [Mesonia algae]PZW39261.1 hypothetical protein LX95_02403 [Mesonia algae]
MGKNTFTVELEGQKKSVTINIAEPEFIEGWWTSDKDGQVPLEKSKLGETVYFHVETKGLAVGQELELNLAEYDYNASGGFLFYDIIDPDDRKFPEDAVVKKATIEQKGNKRVATVELFLDEKWQGIIKDDHDVWFSLDESIELYWEVIYGKRKKLLPYSTDNYLNVAQSDRTLYFKPPAFGHNLPQLMSNDGSPLLPMKFIKGKVQSKLTKKAVKFVNNTINKEISNIAMTKLEKGSLVTNTGREQINPYANIYNYDEIYTNDGTLLKDLKKRKNWGNTNETTKEISQYDYFTKTGKRLQVLGFLKNVGTTLGFFDVLKFGMEDSLDTDSPLGSMGIGGLGNIGGSFALVFSVAGLLMKEMKEEDDIVMEEIVQQELAQAKLSGLEGVRKFVSDWGHNKEYKYDLLPLQEDTVNELLSGKFENLAGVLDYDSAVENFKSPIFVLRRRQMNNNKELPIDIIDTIICDY